MKTLFSTAVAIALLVALYFSGHRHHPSADAPVPRDAVVWDALPVSAATQADAHLLRFSDGTTILIDAGEVAPLVPMLQRLGVHKIDRVLISHPHEDHFGALRSLLQSDISVAEIDMNVPPDAVCALEKGWGCDRQVVLKVLEQARARGIKVGEQKPGDVIHDADGQRLEVLYAFDGVHTPVGVTDANDMSAVLLLTVGNTRALFAGDLNRAIGTFVTDKKDPRLHAQLLKVPHHGTEGVVPDSFFAWVAPEVAIVPAPSALWRSDRSRRIRDWFEHAHVPAYVNGCVGRVRVVMRPDSYRVFLAGF